MQTNLLIYSWETTYTTEIKNFDDHEDIGEVWFGGANSANVVR